MTTVSRFTARIPTPLWLRVRQQAEDAGKSCNDFVVEALQHAVEPTLADLHVVTVRAVDALREELSRHAPQPGVVSQLGAPFHSPCGVQASLGLYEQAKLLCELRAQRDQPTWIQTLRQAFALDMQVAVDLHKTLVSDGVIKTPSDKDARNETRSSL